MDGGVYEKYRENPETAYLGCSMGIIYRDPEDSYYDEAEFAIVKGNTVFGNLMDDVRFYGKLALVRGGIEKIHEVLPDYKYVPMRDVREAMYPEKMTTEQLAEALDEIAEAFDPYEYRDNVEPGENTVQEVMFVGFAEWKYTFLYFLSEGYCRRRMRHVCSCRCIAGKTKSL